MKIQQLKLTNFKGVRSLLLDARGDNVTVYGDNATGKTTLFDAFTWLLFGKDSLGRATFEIKTLTPSGEPHHGLDHEVEATLDVDDRQVVLRKVYREVWTKKRGSANKEFTGHTTDHYIDGVPVQAKEYAAAIAGIADEAVFRLLTSPIYFLGQLHWQERRQVLLEVCGDLTDAEVIASDSALARLPEILGNRNMDDFRKVIAARRTEINRELTAIPVRIDEAMRGLPDVSGLDAKALQADVDATQALIAEKRQQIARIESGGEVADKAKSLQEVEAKLLEIKNSYTSKGRAKVEAAYNEYQTARGQVVELQADIKAMERAIAVNNASIKEKREKMDALRKTWSQVNARGFHHEQADTCPTCGQALPEQQLVEARDKALAQFNGEKADRLAAISAEGKTLKSESDALLAQNVDAEQKLGATRKKLGQLEADCANLVKTIENIRAEAQAYSDDPEYILQMEGKALLESAIAELKAGSSTERLAVDTEITDLQMVKRQTEEKLANLQRHEQGQARIKELKGQERSLAAEYERLESELHLTEQFIRAKVAALENKINSKFKLAQFKLFDTQVNGALIECCEAMHEGVPYGTGLNNAMRINLGLDVIDVLSDHYGVSVPIFVDNAEAVTGLLPTKGQQVRLVVSADDAELRLETESMEEAV